MHIIRYFLLLGGIIVMVATGAWAQEPKFQTRSSDMIQALSKPVVRYRSLPRQILVVEDREDNVTAVDAAALKGVPKLDLKIEFDYDSVAIRAASRPLLAELATALTSDELSDMAILVGGHTDSKGSDDYNLSLSFRRARAVKDYLVRKFDIPAHRFHLRGYGETLPLVSNADAQSRQMNRRVEIRRMD